MHHVDFFSLRNVYLARLGNFSQDAVHRMVEEWRSNLAIVAANRTNNDDRVLMYLGDCLMEMRQEVSILSKLDLAASGCTSFWFFQEALDCYLYASDK